MEEKGGITMENKNEKSKNIIIVILIVMIIGLAGLMCYDKFIVKKESEKSVPTTEKEEEPKVEENKIQSLETTSKNVVDAMKQFTNVYISDTNLYRADIYKISNISNNDLVQTTINNIDRKLIASCVSDIKEAKTEISFTDLNKTLNMVILEKEVNADTIKSLGKSKSFPTLDYGTVDPNSGDDYGIILSKNGIKVLGTCDGFGPGVYPYIEKNIVKAEEDNNYIYIYEKQAFAVPEGHDENYDVIYKYYDNFNHEGSAKESKTKQETIYTPLKWSLYNTYKYTFKIVNGNYYFEQFEKVNK